MIAVVTGASAGIGRATARAFAERGHAVAMIARDEQRLAAAAAECRRAGVPALPIVADIADFAAVEAAADRIERELGPIDLWVNNAMATIFAPLSRITAAEFRRATEVTYLGQVYGTMAALTRMRPRNRGTIVNVGSALAYRAIPLQSPYCGAKYAIRGFTDAVRTELLHDCSAVKLVMAHLPAINTPQFDWALNRTNRRPQPMPPIFQPELAARAIVRAALHPPHREVWVGLSTWTAILANRLAPSWLDRYLARTGYDGQLTAEEQPADAPANLFRTVPAPVASHGRFDRRARSTMWLAPAVTLAGLAAILLVGGRFARRQRDRPLPRRSPSIAPRSPRAAPNRVLLPGVVPNSGAPAGPAAPVTE